MGRLRPAAPSLRSLKPYDPKYMDADVVLSANESGLNLPVEIREAIAARVKTLDFNRYPDPLANKLRDAIAQTYGQTRNNVLVGNGGDELIFDLMLAWGGVARKVLIFTPTFSVYGLYAQITGTQLIEIERDPQDFTININEACDRLAQGDIDLVIVTKPNNPTGTTTEVADIERMCKISDALVLVDEAYGEFASVGSVLSLLGKHENIAILHTFSKAYRAAAARLGFLLAPASVIAELEKVRQPYSVDAISQIVGEEICAHRDVFFAQLGQSIMERERLRVALDHMDGVHVWPSESNFLLFRVNDANTVWQRLYEEHSVLVRNVSDDGVLKNCLRVCAGTPQENGKFIEALEAVLA